MTVDAGIPVLYVLGTGRCGSTVFSNLVGSSEGYVSVGEIYYIWDRGLLENRLCGCGIRFFDCDFWQSVINAAGIAPSAARRGLAIRETSARTRNALRPGTDEDIGEFQDLLGRLYRAVLEVSGKKVIVDSSKFPVYGEILAEVEGIEVSGLHMVRDPRAVAYSRARQKRLRPDHAEDVGPAYFQQQGMLRSGSTWLGWNLLAEVKWRDRQDRFDRVRYEDFVANPDDAFGMIGNSFGIDVNPPKLDSNTYSVRQSHTLSGNPMRFASGPLALRADQEWVDAMPRLRKLAVSLLSLPLLARYGYMGSGWW